MHFMDFKMIAKDEFEFAWDCRTNVKIAQSVDGTLK
jgi:hypothetical protein